MNKKLISMPGVAAAAWATAVLNLAAAAEVPEPFRGHDPDSGFSIQYGDVDSILRVMVVDVGRSTREVVAPTRAQTGTRMRAKISRRTASEGNRFYFEEFEDNKEYRAALHRVRLALEAIPAQITLEQFNRTEQLAYWLNLYNITLLDELVQIDPEKDLEKELLGKNALLDQKILTVAGVPLSLNDIQFTILAQNYPQDPRVMYGLFQGVIGGPNLRRQAYTAKNVYRNLEDNATEFVNSNRGTWSRDGDFEVSTVYDLNRHYFPSFDADLKLHLMSYIQGRERGDLQAAQQLEPDIADWTIADVYGTYQEIGGSFASNQSAMLDAVHAFQATATGDVVETNFSVPGSAYIAKTEPLAALSPEQLELLTTLKTKEEAANLVRQGRVTIEELGVASDSDQDSQAEDRDEPR